MNSRVLTIIIYSLDWIVVLVADIVRKNLEKKAALRLDSLNFVAGTPINLLAFGCYKNTLLRKNKQNLKNVFDSPFS